MPGRSPAGSACGGSIRTRELDSASEPALAPNAKPLAARKPRRVGATKIRATAQPIGSISATAGLTRNHSAYPLR